MTPGEAIPHDPIPFEGWIFLRALKSAIGRTPLWVTTTCVLGALALVSALPWLAWFGAATEHRYEPGSLVRALDETFRFDHRTQRGGLETSADLAGSVLALLAMLFGAFAAGGWLQVHLERTEGQSLRRFFYGGARYFFRFARVLVLTLVSLHVLGWLVYGGLWDWFVLETLFGLPEARLNELDSELTARQIELVQDALYTLGFALVLAWGDYARTRLAVQDTRSALWAGLGAWATLFAHPVRAVRPLLLLWLVEIAVLALATFLTRLVEGTLGPDSTRLSIFGLFAIGAGALLWRSITRGARYAACVQVTHDIVRPLTRPDPWKQSLGGPGGPRYPIGGDEYGVAL